MLIYKEINDSNNAKYESEELGWFYYYNLNCVKWYTLFEWTLRLYIANSSVTTTKSKNMDNITNIKNENEWNYVKCLIKITKKWKKKEQRTRVTNDNNIKCGEYESQIYQNQLMYQGIKCAN